MSGETEEQVRRPEDVAWAVARNVAVEHLDTPDPVPIMHSQQFKHKLLIALSDGLVPSQECSMSRCKRKFGELCGGPLETPYAVEKQTELRDWIQRMCRKYSLQPCPELLAIPLPQETRMNFLAAALNPMWDYIEKSSSFSLLEIQVQRADSIHKEQVRERIRKNKLAEDARKTENAKRKLMEDLLTERIKLLNEEATQAAFEIENEQKNLDCLRKQNTELSMEKMTLEKDTNLLRQELSESRTLLDLFQRKTSEEKKSIEELQKTIETLNATQEETQEEYKTLKQLIAGLEERRSELESDISHLQSKSDEWKMTNSHLSEESSLLHHQSEELLRRIKDSEKLYSKLQSKNSDLDRKNKQTEHVLMYNHIKLPINEWKGLENGPSDYAEHVLPELAQFRTFSPPMKRPTEGRKASVTLGGIKQNAVVMSIAAQPIEMRNVVTGRIPLSPRPAPNLVPANNPKDRGILQARSSHVRPQEVVCNELTPSHHLQPMLKPTSPLTLPKATTTANVPTPYLPPRPPPTGTSHIPPCCAFCESQAMELSNLASRLAALERLESRLSILDTTPLPNTKVSGSGTS
ncbi:hypothetical protein Pelo_11444 [Pelomyxa schiedti]|nr:hypothetical protein Pelo_11444 [Pelomyxa schiedti]